MRALLFPASSRCAKSAQVGPCPVSRSAGRFVGAAAQHAPGCAAPRTPGARLVKVAVRLCLEAEWTEDAIQRITTENTTLKQRVRQLTADNRTLDERLKAARSNLCFQERRMADLEARLTDPPGRT